MCNNFGKFQLFFFAVILLIYTVTSHTKTCAFISRKRVQSSIDIIHISIPGVRRSRGPPADPGQVPRLLRHRPLRPRHRPQGGRPQRRQIRPNPIRSLWHRGSGQKQAGSGAVQEKQGKRHCMEMKEHTISPLITRRLIYLA